MKKKTNFKSFKKTEVNKAIEQVETCLSIKPRKLKSLDIEGVSEYMLKCKNIIFMTGAGISTCNFHRFKQELTLSVILKNVQILN